MFKKERNCRSVIVTWECQQNSESSICYGTMDSSASAKGVQKNADSLYERCTLADKRTGYKFAMIAKKNLICLNFKKNK